MQVRLTLAAVLLVVLPGCGDEEQKDDAVLAELAGLDITALPAGASQLARVESRGGGSDVAGVAGASAIRLTYASPETPEEVAAWYHQEYDGTWRLHDNGYSPDGGVALVGALRGDDATTVTVDAREPRPADGVPVGTGSVVALSVARTRD
jgi:hypothetical protein